MENVQKSDGVSNVDDRAWGRIFTASRRSVGASRWSTRFLLLAIAAVSVFGVMFNASPEAVAAPEPMAESNSVIVEQTHDSDTSIVAQTQNPTQPPLSDEEIGRNESGAESALLGPTSSRSPADFRNYSEHIGSMQTANKYMVFYRWFGVSDIPSPDTGFTSMAQIPQSVLGFFGKMIFSAASMVALAMGFGLTLAMSVDLLSKVLYFADYMFYYIGTKLLGMNTPSGILGLIVVGTLITVGAGVVIPRFKPNSEFNSYKSVMSVLMAITITGLIAVQATKNHNDPEFPSTDKAPIAAMATSGYGSNIVDGPQDAIKDSSLWAMGSPGWIVAKSTEIINHAGGAFGSVINGLTQSMTATSTSGYGTACDRYVDAMHAIYQNTDAGRRSGGKDSVIIAYDNLVRAMYFQNYQRAALGDTQSARESWCRKAETQSGSEAGDQIFISRVAGLYSEIIGTGGMEVFGGSQNVVNPQSTNQIVTLAGEIPNSSPELGYSDGMLVNADGTWATDTSRQLVNSLFGPDFWSGKAGDKNVSGSQMSIFYFAACIWPKPGGSVMINPEWQQARIGSSGKFDPKKEFGDDIGKCGIGEDADGGLLTEREFGSDFPTSNNFNYYQYDGYVAVEVPFFGTYGIGEQAAVEQFSNAPEAKSFYNKVMGGDSAEVLVLALTAMVLMYMMIRYFGPIVIGTVFAQGIATLILILAPLTPLALFVPGAKTKHMFKTLAQTLLAALLVVTMLGILFMVAFAIVSLFIAVFGTITSNPVTSSFLTGFASIMALWIIVKAVNAFLKTDITDPKAALAVGVAAGSPVLRQMGFDVVSPVDPSFWQKQKEASEARDITTDEDVAVGATDIASDDEKDLRTDERSRLDKMADLAARADQAAQVGVKATGGTVPWMNAAAVAAKGAAVTTKVLSSAGDLKDKIKDKAHGGFEMAKELGRYTITGDKDKIDPVSAKHGEMLFGGDLTKKPAMSDADLADAGLPSANFADGDSEVAKNVGAGSQQRASQLGTDEVVAAIYDSDARAHDRTVGTTSAPLERDGAVAWQSPEATAFLADQASMMAEMRAAANVMSETFDPSNLNINDLYAERQLEGEERRLQAEALTQAANNMSDASEGFNVAVNTMSDVATSMQESAQSFSSGIDDLGIQTSTMADTFSDMQSEQQRQSQEILQGMGAHQQEMSQSLSEAVGGLSEVGNSMQDSVSNFGQTVGEMQEGNAQFIEERQVIDEQALDAYQNYIDGHRQS